MAPKNCIIPLRAIRFFRCDVCHRKFSIVFDGRRCCPFCHGVKISFSGKVV